MRFSCFILVLFYSVSWGAQAASSPPNLRSSLDKAAHNIVCLGWVDLQGTPRSIQFSSPKKDCKKPTSYKRPALFVKWRKDQRAQYVDALVQDEQGTYTSIWHATLSAPHFKTINAIQLRRFKDQLELDIVIHQTAMPSAPREGSQSGKISSFRPGPPLERRFVFFEHGYLLAPKSCAEQTSPTPLVCLKRYRAHLEKFWVKKQQASCPDQTARKPDQPATYCQTHVYTDDERQAALRAGLKPFTGSLWVRRYLRCEINWLKTQLLAPDCP